MDADAATLSTGERIPARTVAWTAGVRPSPAVAALGLPLGDDRRIVVDATMRVQGRENVWAIGDAAAVPDPAKKGKSACPPTAQHALRQGKAVARHVAAALAGAPPALSLPHARRVRRHGPAQARGHAFGVPALLPRLVRRPPTTSRACRAWPGRCAW